jgi:hypothetical protein
LSNEYKNATDRYLAWLGLACLITLPFIGFGAILIWATTAFTLYGVTASLLRRGTRDPPCPRKPRRRKRSGRDGPRC